MAKSRINLENLLHPVSTKQFKCMVYFPCDECGWDDGTNARCAECRKSNKLYEQAFIEDMMHDADLDLNLDPDYFDLETGEAL